MRNIRILFLILIVGFILRIYGLNQNPPSLNWDEVSHGYNAYSILKTGRDEWGQLFPITNFRAYGDYPLPLYMYLSLPWIFMLGLNELSVRLTSAIFGTLLILSTFLITLEIFKRKEVALLASFLIAVSPWGVLTSRQVLQATPAVFFISLGFWLFLRVLRNKGSILFGIIGLGISAYGYHNTRILALPILALFFASLKRYIRKKALILYGVITILIFAPVIWALISSEGRARSVWVGILDQGAINRINELRGTSSLPDPVATVFYNKASFFVMKSLTNYLEYFNPYRLAVTGGSHYQFSIPNRGVMFPVELPFLYIGLFVLIIFFRKNSTQKKLLIIWILLAPIPAAITRDVFHVVRALTMLPVIYIITAYGFFVSLDYLRRKVIFGEKKALVFFISVIGVLSMDYQYSYWQSYLKEYSFAWQYGYKQVVEFIKDNENKYQSVVITKRYGEAHEFLLFYSGYDPKSYREDPNLVRYESSNWFWVDRFNKYFFVNDWEVVEKTKTMKNTLIITSPANYPVNARFMKTIFYLDGKAAFDIVEI